MAGIPKRPKTTTVPLSQQTKRQLESIKLSDGEESWDHQLSRLYRIAKAAESRGLLPELSAA
jgi:hypothetical protein